MRACDALLQTSRQLLLQLGAVGIDGECGSGRGDCGSDGSRGRNYCTAVLPAAQFPTYVNDKLVAYVVVLFVCVP